MIRRIRKSILYRLAKSHWHQLAIYHAFEGYAGKKVFLSKINLTLDKGCHIQLLKGYDKATDIVNYGGVFKIEGKLLLLDIDGLTLEIQTAEEIFIVHEIFVNSCYEFHLDKDCVLIDIGMNVGIASLYFSSKVKVKKIFGYEPFNPTFEQAQINFERNPRLKSKIEPFNIGLGNKDFDVKVEYSPENRGRVGLQGRKLIKDRITDLTIEKVIIKSVDEIFKNIFLKFSESIVVKMDCEGAEFEIIDTLRLNNLLEKIDVLMIEWHDKNPSPIIEALTEAGFRSFKNNYSAKFGMIYAAR